MKNSLLLVMPSLALCLSPLARQKRQSDPVDPCTPNPCGDYTRCEMAASANGLSAVISCSCLIGYQVPVGGDSLDGCEPVKSGNPVLPHSGRPLAPLAAPESSSTTRRPPPLLTTTLTTTTTGDQGQVFRESEAVQRSLDEEDSDQKRLHDGQRPGQLRPRGGGNKVVNEVFVDVDNKELFPEDCLVHEDCEDSQFCSPEDGDTCVEACVKQGSVCGTGAVCTAKLHRPVCACQVGFQGNPYDECTQTPSRVGMKFRK